MPRHVRLSEPAQDDVVEVLLYTLDQFGRAQFDAYDQLIEKTLNEIAEAHDQPPAKQRPELMPNVWVRPIRKPGQHARHMLIYRVTNDGTIEIGRLLHDAMDIERHLPEDYLR